MNEGLIARRYATALLKFAQERGAAEAVYEKMKLFEQNYIAHPDLHKALLNPVLSQRDKELLLSTAVDIEPGDIYIRGIRLLLKNHREMYVRSICLMYQQIYRKTYHIARVTVITAVELEDSLLTRIKALVGRTTSDKVEFQHRIDPSVIGGFVLRVDSVQLDSSIRKELKDLRLKFKS